MTATNDIIIELKEQPGIKAWYKRKTMPEDLKALLHLLHQCSDKTHNYVQFRCMVFHIYKKLEEKVIILPLPYYWGSLGIYIEWGSLSDMLELWGYTLVVQYK